MRSTVDILRELNTATKYPSIQTYHTIDHGFLVEDGVTQYPEGGEIIGTEKVDGTNCRMIFMPGGEWLIGSREELLYAGGDICYNPSMGIVDALRVTANDIYDAVDPDRDQIVVVYGELFGSKITGAAKNYTTQPNTVAFRMFDVAEFNDADHMLGYHPEVLSGMRERQELQTWYNELELQNFAKAIDIELTPRIFTVTEQLPQNLPDMLGFLRVVLPRTRVLLDATGQGLSEGMVLRTPDRRVISKARFQDYEKTLRRMSRPKR